MSEIWAKQKIGRLALRVEGENWVAYYAQPDTMDGAFFLAAMHMRFLETEKRKQAFMALMKDCIGDLIEEVAGQRPLWSAETSAPDHERAE